MTRDQVFDLISCERVLQDKMYGGKQHDTKHSDSDWLIFIERFLNKAKESFYHGNDHSTIESMVKIAALATAFLETKE